MKAKRPAPATDLGSGGSSKPRVHKTHGLLLLDLHLILFKKINEEGRRLKITPREITMGTRSLHDPIEWMGLPTGRTVGMGQIAAGSLLSWC